MQINFKKVHTGKDITISSIILLAGIGLFFVNKGLGICIAVCGLLMLLIYKGGYKKDGKGAVLTKKSEDLCKGCRTSIVEFLGGKDTIPYIKKRQRRRKRAAGRILQSGNGYRLCPTL